MPSSNAFSFYDAATVVQEQEAEKSLGNTEEDASPACSMEEETSLDVDDVRDEADVIVKEDEEEGANAAKPTELRTTVISGPGGVNQWLDRANALNEIRVMLKEEIEQDSAMFSEFNDVITAQSEKIDELNQYIVQQMEEHEEETGTLSSAINDLTNANTALKEENTNVMSIVETLESKIDEYGDQVEKVVEEGRQSNEVLKEKLKAAADEIVKMEAENAENLAKAAADIATRERTIEMGQTSINALQDNISASREEITKLKSAEKKLQTKLGEEKAANKTLKKDNTSLAEGIKALHKSVKDLKKGKADVEEKQTKKMDELKETNEVLKEKLKAAADEIVKMKDELSTSKKDITKLQSAEKKLQTKLGEEKAANKALKDDNTGLAEGFAAMTKSVKDLKKEKADAEEKISSQAKMMDELKKDLKNAMKVVTKLQAIEKELNNDLDEMTKSSVDIETVKAVAEEKMNKQMTH